LKFAFLSLKSDKLLHRCHFFMKFVEVLLRLDRMSLIPA